MHQVTHALPDPQGLRDVLQVRRYEHSDKMPILNHREPAIAVGEKIAGSGFVDVELGGQGHDRLRHHLRDGHSRQ